MPIRDIIADDMLYDLKRNDHIVFSLNTLGQHPKGVGYGFIDSLLEDYGVTDLKDTGNRQLGDIVTIEVPEHHLWLHGIVNHDPIQGWPVTGRESTDSYLATLKALNELAEKWEDEIPLGFMKSLWLGRGKMRKLGESAGTTGNIIWMMQMMATSDLNLQVYILDGYGL